jgi:hypothetical protein
MKNLFYILISLLFFTDVNAQLVSSTSVNTSDNSDVNYSRSNNLTNHSGYIPIALRGWNVVWVFNDVGNLHSQRNGTDNNSIPEAESSNSSVLEISLYPIPAKDNLNFKFSRDLNSGTISIYDGAGKIILTQNFSGKEAVISSDDLIPGIYFYQVLAENKAVSSGKFMKQ